MPLQSWKDLLNQAEDGGGWEILPAADYDLKIVKAEATMANSGKLMYKVVHEVTTGPYAGKKIWDQIVVSPDNPTALSIFFRTMNALGIDKAFFASNPSDDQVASALVGRNFRGQVGIRNWQNQERNELKRYSPMTDKASSPTPPPPPVVQQPAVQQPTTAAPTTPTAPASQPQAAAVAEPAPLPPKIESTPEPPQQPAVPPVPDTPPATPPPTPQPQPAAVSSDGEGSALPPPPPF